MSKLIRRRFLGTVGATFVGLGAVSNTANATSGGSENQRFLVDLRKVDRSKIPTDTEIIHDLSQVDVLVARGNPKEVPGSGSTALDLTVYQRDGHGHLPVGNAPGHGGDGHGPGGPAQKHGPRGHHHDETLLYTELQWDKRAQRLDDHLLGASGSGHERRGKREGHGHHSRSDTVHDVTRGEGTRVAVIDTGVYDAHPDLKDVVNDDLSRNFTEDGGDFRPDGSGDHGTHCAGIIAATNSNDGKHGGVLGTAPETEVLALRVFPNDGSGAATGDVLAALTYAADNACDAANLSLGFPVPYVYPDKYPSLLQIAALYERVVAYARNAGTVVVNAAGNDSLNMTPKSTLALPTEVPGVFGVSATGPIGFLWDDKTQDVYRALEPRKLRKPTDYPAHYTNYGHGVDVSAAGGNYDESAVDGNQKWYYDLVLSTIFEEQDGETIPAYGWMAGTSMAAPQVAGAVALARSLRPNSSAAEVESLLRETARPAPKGPEYHGSGHLNLLGLVYRAKARGRGKGEDYRRSSARDQRRKARADD